MTEKEFRTILKNGFQGIENHFEKHKGAGSVPAKITDSFQIVYANFDMWGCLFGAKKPKVKRENVVFFYLEEKTERGFFQKERSCKEYEISPIKHVREEQIKTILKDAYTEFADHFTD